MLSSLAIKTAAHELGFDLCGIAPAESFPELRYLRDWLARGYAGNMSWMGRTARVRADVRAIVPGARSVIVTGTIYNSDRPYTCGEEPSDRALISRYAWGDDYHAVLQARLDALLEWMRCESDEPFDARAYVDTGPVQERVYAQYAGLGWVGKNTCLINAELGSWLFLAEIITTVALDPDAQGLEQCGSCTRCLDACPTGALVEPGVLDAKRCLSYLTIELRKGIPLEYRDAVGTRVYGCDICQEVCPYNQVPPRSPDAAWQPRPGFDTPRLVDLWRRSDSDLLELLQDSAMTRAGLTSLRRNLAVAVGNSADAAALAALDETGPDRESVEDEVVRDHVRWAKEKVRG